jgi:hypothetical protein
MPSRQPLRKTHIMMLLIDSKDRSSRDGRLNRRKILCALPR